MNVLNICQNEEFSKVRIFEIENEVWFVGKDICNYFNDTNHNRTLSRVEADDKRYIKIKDNLGRNQNAVAVNESGMYSILFSMQPQKANNGGVTDAYPIEVQERIDKLKRFKHWVTSEVLPSIRKTGTYGIKPQGKELLALAVLEAQKIIEEQNQQIEEMKPKVQFADAITACDTSILIRDLAKLLRQNKVPTGEKRLYRWMRENGYIVKGTTQPTQRAMELGLFEVIERSIVRGDHLPQVKMTTKVTTKGQCYFINKILSESKKVNNG